ncbi:hypothetical protein [Nannocystis pusilla]|uniref:Lipoprotein n=1 Tax=Nannocystis pusilla TaxID=889268 RepID=A0ABS7U021_9BACT|nr:hypothetical protein [Nannocystis pusilla]MBZ5713756.1 hypothetical protein [Nannocystis pusilla]
MNIPCALRPVITLLLLVALTPACSEDPPADASSGDTSDTPGATADTSDTIDEPPTTGPDSDGESTSTTSPTGPDVTGTSDPSGSSSGDDTTGSGTGGGEPGVLGSTQDGCSPSGERSPSLPHEAGYLTATVLTPDTYPFAVSRVQYTLRRNLDVGCVNTYAHRLEIYVTEGGKPPAMPSTEASTFMTIAVEESLEDVNRRVLEPELDPPIVLTDGQSLVVAVSLEADLDAGMALCLEICVGDPDPGVDFWGGAPAEPYNWDDLVADYGFSANQNIAAFGTAL